MAEIYEDVDAIFGDIQNVSGEDIWNGDLDDLDAVLESVGVQIKEGNLNDVDVDESVRFDNENYSSSSDTDGEENLGNIHIEDKNDTNTVSNVDSEQEDNYQDHDGEPHNAGRYSFVVETDIPQPNVVMARSDYDEYDFDNNEQTPNIVVKKNTDEFIVDDFDSDTNEQPNLVVVKKNTDEFIVDDFDSDTSDQPNLVVVKKNSDEYKVEDFDNDTSYQPNVVVLKNSDKLVVEPASNSFEFIVAESEDQQESQKTISDTALNHQPEPFVAKLTFDNSFSTLESTPNVVVVKQPTANYSNYQSTSNPIQPYFAPVSNSEGFKSISAPNPTQAPEGFCNRCKQQIRPDQRMLKAIGRTYHTEHFQCTRCNSSLGTVPFYPINGQPYCQSCYGQTDTSACAKCGHLVTRGTTFLRAVGKVFHPGCFGCVRCASTLDPNHFFVKNEKVVCANCYSFV